MSSKTQKSTHWCTAKHPGCTLSRICYGNHNVIFTANCSNAQLESNNMGRWGTYSGGHIYLVHFPFQSRTSRVADQYAQFVPEHPDLHQWNLRIRAQVKTLHIHVRTKTLWFCKRVWFVLTWLTRFTRHVEIIYSQVTKILVNVETTSLCFNHETLDARKKSNFHRGPWRHGLKVNALTYF